MSFFPDLIKPKSLTCYICGREFGTRSLSIHLKTCIKKWELQEMSKPKKERRPIPAAPSNLSQILDKENLDWPEIEAYNVEANKRYYEDGLVKCEFCNRSFFDHRIEGHKKICTKENPFKPLKRFENETCDDLKIKNRSRSVSKIRTKEKTADEISDPSPMMKFRMLREREKEKEKDKDKEILKDKENPKDKEKELTWNSIQTKERNQTERSKTPLRIERAKTEKPRKRVDSSTQKMTNEKTAEVNSDLSPMTKFRLLREREKEKETDKEILKDNPKDKEKELTWNSNQTKERNQTARSKTSLITESAKPEKQRKRELRISFMQEPNSQAFFLDRAKCSNPELADKIKNAALHHIASFDYIYEEGLSKIVQNLAPMEIIPHAPSSEEENGPKHVAFPFKSMKIWFEDLSIGYPYKPGEITLKDARLFPSECRIAGKTYSAPLLCTIARSIDDDIKVEKIKMSLGEIPIMAGSKHCHLRGLSASELVSVNEDCTEFGGYFIINGLEKLIRMIILQKKNYPIAFIRNSYTNRGPNFTGFAAQMKCVRSDLYSRTLTLHYISDGNVILRLLHRKQEFLIPVIVILKALQECTDLEIYNNLVRGYSGKSHISDRVEVLIRAGQKMSLTTRRDCLKYLGMNFRIMLNINADVSDAEVGEIFLREHIAVHLEHSNDKFRVICLLIEKLYALVSNEIQPDNLDSLCNHEVLLPGHLYTMILREKLEEILQGIRFKLFKDASKAGESIKIRDLAYLKKAIESQTTIGRKLEYFLSTGNLKSQSGLDLMQAKGYTIIAEKLNNMRFLSHFRSIHRGAFFAEMKTTAVRKLLPENWGFMCPVHTPDGHPCGLLNHITESCQVLSSSSLTEKHFNLEKVLISLGMEPIGPELSLIYPSSFYTVLLDGKVIGYVNPELMPAVIENLRRLKVMQFEEMLVPRDLEIGLIPKGKFEKTVQFPGLYLSTREARMIRPVKNLLLNREELISPFEQVYLSIACSEEDIRSDTTYQEINPGNILSILAGNIPFLEYNQSPRNMYQCQMAKQTMGTPYHNYPYRFDNKVYRLMTPQIPMVKGKSFESYGLADYPSGTNAIVAVISYTGYDMEDAMILNKSSYERGMAHGSVYKTFEYSINESSAQTSKKPRFKLLTQLRQKNQTNENLENLDIDGMARIGSVVKKGNAELKIFDTVKNEYKTFYHKEGETGRIDQIALVSNNNNPGDVKLLYKVRYCRNPVIGDKFSSRHGQKGVLSVLWPQTDMPFSENGICPDIIINPNAFPSRMTIGMLVESLAGKTGALYGHIQETEPFRRYEKDDAVRYFGEQLVKKGYNYYGNEVMYSGIYGNVMKADIYMGVVYYQRLRHMVSDKSQARATGPVDVLTQQPVKGRKKQGGIRLGEMERDALLAHGVAFALHDRLLNCSDLSEGYVCMLCGGILSAFIMAGKDELEKGKPACKMCNTSKVAKVSLPFVLRYLTNELAAMNIKLMFNLS